ncbi:MAG: ABC transporter ATP-binding protein [Eubacteriales bacterium]|nr:ABC transporter ATP-binding protein [Eubacteriales bacterium]
MALLSVKKITKSFGGLMAVSNVSIEIEKGELVGLIGPNGGGKTTVFNLLTGIYVPTSGTVEINNGTSEKFIQGMKPYKICAEGMARTFQNIRLFKDLTVLDNVRIAMHKNVKYGLIAGFLHLPSYVREEKELIEKSMNLLEILKLDSKKDVLARNLPYGEQRHLEIARALATDPILLLLDEPAAGMNPAETSDLKEMILWIKEKFKLTVLLIDHDMSLIMNICERIYVLDHGMLIANGTADQIKSNKLVIEAYLGEDVSDA